MAIESKNLVVALKAFSPANPLPLDARELYNTLGEAEAYAKAANAYAGQTIKVLQNGKYETYVLNGEAGAYTLDKVGVDASMVKNYVQVVSALPEKKEQGVIYINTSNKKGYIWTGSADQVIFEDVTTLNKTVETLGADVQAIKDAKAEYARLDGATFTGTVVLNKDPEQNLEAATKQYVDKLINGINSFVIGLVDSGHALPTKGYQVGQTFRVAEAGTYAGQVCEIGDLIIVISDYKDVAKNEDFLVVQANVDGTVTGAESSIDANIAVFDGVTGKKIKDSTVTIQSVKDAIAGVKTLTTNLGKTNETVAALTKTVEGKAEQSALEALTQTVEAKADASALVNYATIEALGAKADATTVQALETTVKTKLDKSAVDAAIDAKTEITGETVKAYVDRVVKAGGTDQAGVIEQAKKDAIAAAKTETTNQINTAFALNEF